MHDLTAAIFYALARNRLERGTFPDREDVIHQFVKEKVDSSSTTASKSNNNNNNNNNTFDLLAQSVADLLSEADKFIATNGNDAENTTTTNSDDGNSNKPKNKFQPVCSPASTPLLSSMLFYAPLALDFVYREDPLEIQLLAAQQGWNLLYAALDQKIKGTSDQPASCLFAHKKRKVACLVIRGTTTVHDVLTDLRAEPVKFPSPTIDDLEEEEWGVVNETSIDDNNGIALCGMARAAEYLFKENVDVLVKLASEGYMIRCSGHSLGGGVAALLSLLLQNHVNAVLSGDVKKCGENSRFNNERVNAFLRSRVDRQTTTKIRAYVGERAKRAGPRGPSNTP